jgi:hypothetical protein
MERMSRSRGLSYATGAATTTAAAVAIPVLATEAKIEILTGECKVGVGNSSSAPALDTTNSVLLGTGAVEIWAVDVRRSVDTHIYVRTTSGTSDYRISFYG